MNGSCWREEQIMIAELSLARTGRPGRRRSMQNGAHPNDIHIHTHCILQHCRRGKAESEAEGKAASASAAAKAHNISNQQRQMITIITRRMTPIVMSTAGRTVMVVLLLLWPSLTKFRGK